jgi:hypothetical protein
MTKIRIEPGACGMPVIVEVRKKDKKNTFTLSITSECEMVQKLGRELPELTLMDIFKKLPENPVYKKGAVCLKHTSCPVPAGILKALEVEGGLAVPKDVSIIFIRE